MFVLFESSIGYAIFKLTKEKKLQKIDKLYKELEDPDKASKVLNFTHFEKFKDASDALSATTALIEGKMNKKLKKMLKKIVLKEEGEQLAVADPKLAQTIKDKLDINTVTTTAVQELMHCIRSKAQDLIPEWSFEEEAAMQLGLSHGLGRYKLRFSPDKVDTMIIQAVSLLDDLDKELNNYIMRVKEWYGWHFPELGKIVVDNTAYIKSILVIGMRSNAVNVDLSEILPEDLEAQIKVKAEVSMGTDISQEDLDNIFFLAENALEMLDYRAQLYDYLKNRMMAIAPNLTILVGELVGARLISHAGSLLNLAKHPASTVQILGAEKALFRALKTKHDTPKYGLIYHAQLIGQSNPKLKGKMSRMLAAKSALACRVDALGETTSTDLGTEHRAKLESRLKFLEEGNSRRISGTGKGKARVEKYEHQSQLYEYKAAADSTLPSSSKKKKFKQESKAEEEDQELAEEQVDEEMDEDSPPIFSSGKKSKKRKGEEAQPAAEEEQATEPKKKKKDKRKSKAEPVEESQEEEPVTEPEPETPKSSKKKKKKAKAEAEQSMVEEEQEVPVMVESGSKKKKKKKKSKQEEEEEDSD